MKRLLSCALIVCCSSALAGTDDGDHEPFAGGLGKTLDGAAITVSGISAGGFMAQQLHLAYADRISGVGVLAAGPWGCAEGNLMTALARCMAAEGAEPPVERLVELANESSASGRLAPLDALADDRVWLFRGERDAVVGEAVAGATEAFYGHWLDAAALVRGESLDAAHTFPTVSAGGACDESAAPFVAACDYDAAGALLAHLHGSLNEPADSVGALESIEVEAAAEATMLETAYVYVPTACRAADGDCDVHVVLHGCAMSTESLGTSFIEQAGYRRWAESNGLVLLYPQVAASGANPYGCWDWWGYTGTTYQDRDGPHLKAIMGLVDQLASR